MDEKKFYEELKQSINPRNFTSIDETDYANDYANLITQLKSFHLNVKSFKQNQVYVYCLIGRNLSFLQNIFKKEPTMGNFIDSIKKTFPEYGYSKSYIYFIIKLYNTASEYNKLAFTTFPLRKIRTNFKLICELIKKDEIFWKNTPLSSH